MGRHLLHVAFAWSALPLLALAQKSSGPSSPPSSADWDPPDSIGAITVRPVPEKEEPAPLFLRHADDLRDHHDVLMAAAYLRSIVERTDLKPSLRARVMLELADCLQANRQVAESLSWLKLWMQLYSARPETGAVAFRIGTLYTQMGLPDLARDSYYKALSRLIDQGQVLNSGDLAHYSRLTQATLWALAMNEYRDGQWARAAKLFIRYRTEANSPPPLALETASFLEADCYYQQRQNDAATSAYELALQQHPFNPLAPESRLRLYHLDLLANKPDRAREQLEALIWSVRTAWPKEEAHWQKRTAETLLALNRKNDPILPALVEKSGQLPGQGKAWQEELAHYDRLVRYQATAQTSPADASLPPPPVDSSVHPIPEAADLLAMEQSIHRLDPTTLSASSNP